MSDKERLVTASLEFKVGTPPVDARPLDKDFYERVRLPRGKRESFGWLLMSDFEDVDVDRATNDLANTLKITGTRDQFKEAFGITVPDADAIREGCGRFEKEQLKINRKFSEEFRNNVSGLDFSAPVQKAPHPSKDHRGRLEFRNNNCGPDFDAQVQKSPEPPQKNHTERVNRSKTVQRTLDA